MKLRGEKHYSFVACFADSNGNHFLVYWWVVHWIIAQVPDYWNVGCGLAAPTEEAKNLVNSVTPLLEHLVIVTNYSTL